jgi:hypothetical protein
MECRAYATIGPGVRTQEFFQVVSDHWIACDAETAIIHMVMRITRDSPNDPDKNVESSGTWDCIETALCGPRSLSAIHARGHDHGSHLWHAWTSGHHEHTRKDRKRNIQWARSPDCFVAGRPILGRNEHVRMSRCEAVLAEMPLIDMPPTGPETQIIVASGAEAGMDWTLSAWTEPERVFWRFMLSPSTRLDAWERASSISYAWLPESQEPHEEVEGAAPQGAFIDWAAVTEPRFGPGAATDLGHGPLWIDGVALDPSVASVRLVLTGDRTVDIPIVGRDSGLPVGLFVHRLSAGQRLRWIVALDAEGSELERLDASLTLEV